ncbi:MAG: alpha/beta fold hydrolase [Candidatus Pacearchaeota archaeon]|jgi:hypothetical protein
MAKKVYIIHGWEGSPNEPMHQWLKATLEKKGFEVIAPEMPNPSIPKIDVWVKKINSIVKNPDKDTYFIGHSIGCQTILRYLETLDKNIKLGGIVFIAPWLHLNGIEDEGEESIKIASPWLETPIDFNKVKSHLNKNKIIAIFSDNDQFVPLSDIKLFEKNLNVKTVLEHNKGHFTKDDGVDSNQTAIDELLEIVG